MREDICSIPVNDVFKPKDGCPFCTMRDMLEDRMATYITGAAMMEPSIRVETNRLGFCKTHFDQILERGSRLSVALILESLLDEVKNDLMPEGKQNIKKITVNAEKRANSCFVCENIEKNMDHLIESTVKHWANEPEFRTLYAEQPYICTTHYADVLKASNKLPRKTQAEFLEITKKLTETYLDELKKDVTHFCRMFDYRNAGGDWGNSKDAIERTIEYLTTRKLTTTTKTEGKNI